MINQIQTVALTSAGNGISLVATNGNAGSAQNPILVTKSLIAGTGMKIVAGDSDVDIIISATGLPGLTSLITANVHWTNGALAPSLPVIIAAYPLIVTAINGRPEQISSTAGTIMLVKAVSGTAIAAGLPLITTAFNVASPSVAFVTQSMILVPNITTLTLAAGDCVAVQTTGTWTTASGGITVHMAPAY